MSHTATLSAYYKGDNNALRKVSATIGIDPEGVTEEDVNLFRMEVFEHYFNTENIHRFPLQVFVVIPGGKA